MSLLITDAQLRETTGFPTLPYLSADGKLAYVVYEITATENIKVGAELFSIVNGKFTSLAQYLVNDEFISVDGGAAAHNFQRFTIIEDNQNGLFRIRLLEYHTGSGFVIVGERTVPAITDGYTPYGGVFLEDDSAIVVTAAISVLNDQQTSKLWLLANQPSLNILNEYTDVVVYPTVAATFSVDDEQFIAVTASHGILDFNDLPRFWQAPHTLRVFRASNGLLALDYEAYLPQGGFTVSALKRKCYTLLSVGTYAALPSNTNNTLLVRTPENTAANNADTAELRFYKFKPPYLKLYKTQDTNSTVDAVLVTSKEIIVAQNVGPYNAFLPSCFSIKTQEDKVLVRPCGGAPSFVTDEEERIYLLTSASADPPLYRNLVLFRLIDNCV